MDIYLTEEQTMITQAVRRFVREEIRPLERDLDPDAVELAPGEADRLREIVRGMGLYNMDVPEEYGGPGIDLTTRALIAEELAQHRAGLYLPCYGVFGSAGLVQLYAGNDEQKERYLFPMLKGEKRGFFGLTEPSGGSDPARAIQTRAIKDGDEIIGRRTRIKVVKNKVAPPFREAEFDIMFRGDDVGISREGDLLDLGVNGGFVEKSGTWFSYSGERLGQGRENARLFLRDNDELCTRLEIEVRQALNLKVPGAAAPAAEVPDQEAAAAVELELV